jgi:hypothetical protein
VTSERYDEHGRTLYAGEVISGRRFTPARRVGWRRVVAIGSVWVVLLHLAGAPWLLAALVVSLAGQIVLNAIQRNYSRKIWAFADQEREREKLAEKPTPEEAERRKARAGRDEKIRNVKVALEAELPFVDYDSGEVWPTGTLADRLAELEREAEAHDAIDDLQRDLERKERNQDRSAEVASRVPLNMDPGGQWVVRETGLLRGRPANPGAARRAKLSDGMIVELTNFDLARIKELAPAIQRSEIAMLPSGHVLTGHDIVTLYRDLRRIESVVPEPCEHGCPAHRECPYCMIDLGTPEEIERGRNLLDDHQIQSWAAGPWADYPETAWITMPSGMKWLGRNINRRVRDLKVHQTAERAAEPRSSSVQGTRPVRAIERDMEQLRLDLEYGRLYPDTARSLEIDLAHELRLAREAESDVDD